MFPQPLPLLHQSEYLDMEYHRLLNIYESAEIISLMKWLWLSRTKQEARLTLNFGLDIELVVLQLQG